ncbi:MAG: hypothetical protein E7359_00670 [Clostridiales bacterium]|nr:hypothetical protein [Clostridiales bacterium]
MIFKNTFKLLLSNFNLTYKILLHKLIAFLLAIGIAGTIGEPFLMHLAENKVFDYILNETIYLFENINIGNIFIYIKTIFNEIIIVIQNLNLSLLINALVAICTFFVIYKLISGLSELAVIDCLNGNMSSKTKLSFFKSLISKMFKSFSMSIIKFIISIPVIISLGFLFYYGFIFYDIYGGVAKILIPFVMFSLFVLVIGFYLSLIAGFSSSIIVNGEGVFKSLKRGFSAINKKYFRVLSTSIIIVFLLTISNLFLAAYSFFASLILTLPMTTLILCLFKIVTYYECNGMRYYVGENIRTPLRVCEQDKMKKLKYIV